MSRLASTGSLAAALVTAHLLANLARLRSPRTSDGHLGSHGGRCAAGPPRVSVLVPARNEAWRIGPSIRSILASTGVEAELIVLDDESNDGTGDAVVAAAAGDPRLRVLAGAPPPPGWLGKPHACAQLAAAATGPVLAFVDADVVLAADGLAASVELLGDGGLDLVCPYPRQVAEGTAARLVQPLLQWSWLAFLPLGLAERSPRTSLVAANGQLLVCDAAAYRAVGGHAAVRGAVVEDVGLARAFKRAGYRATVADGTRVATCHMYAGWPQVREGYAKSLWAAFGSPAGAVAAVGLLAWLYVVPPVTALRALAGGRRRAALVPALGYAAAVVGRAAAARRTGGRPADGLAHPASIAVLGYLVALSWSRKATGRLSWRGRPVRG